MLKWITCLKARAGAGLASCCRSSRWLTQLLLDFHFKGLSLCSVTGEWWMLYRTFKSWTNSKGLIATAAVWQVQMQGSLCGREVFPLLDRGHSGDLKDSLGYAGGEIISVVISFKPTLPVCSPGQFLVGLILSLFVASPAVMYSLSLALITKAASEV